MTEEPSGAYISAVCKSSDGYSYSYTPEFSSDDTGVRAVPSYALTLNSIPAVTSPSRKYFTLCGAGSASEIPLVGGRVREIGFCYKIGCYSFTVYRHNCV